VRTAVQWHETHFGKFFLQNGDVVAGLSRFEFPVEVNRGMSTAPSADSLHPLSRQRQRGQPAIDRGQVEPLRVKTAAHPLQH
jgi:hypothetical protein